MVPLHRSLGARAGESALFERKLAVRSRNGRIVSGRGAKHGPLTLKDVDPPDARRGWYACTCLASICGDLATTDSAATEPIVVPFTLAEVRRLDDCTRGVIPSICATAASIRRATPARRARSTTAASAFGPRAGLQSGFCESTGGDGRSRWRRTRPVAAHPRRRHRRTGQRSSACRVRGARRRQGSRRRTHLRCRRPSARSRRCVTPAVWHRRSS
jgi:hypothetical protein